MEMRKVQITGGCSFTVTLPKGWVESVHLKAGDVVGLSQQPDGSLLLRARPTGGRTARTYHWMLKSEAPEHVFRKLIAIYLMGYDVIKVTGKPRLTPQIRATLQEAGRRTIGLEVVDEDPSGLTLQDFLDPAEFSLERGLRRMLHLTQGMLTEALERVHTRDPAALKALMARDDEVDRLYWMINKQYHALLQDSAFHERMGLTATQALNYLLAARLVERMADHATRIAENLLELEGNLPQAFEARVVSQGNRAIQLVRDASAAFFKKSVPEANATIDAVDIYHKEQHALLEEALELRRGSLVHIAYILESQNRIAAYAADLAETAINHKVAAVEPLDE
ncbi:MAG TPA: phosphate uptake regulator PhoU [Candidatus Thermoplasmatota archaeon]|nr:phosphate uptake regulator PhoU [Candidatus Thermoplasmatota archaeon]